jgi:hypothetical protein
MVPVVIAGKVLGEATPPSGNIFNEAMRGRRKCLGLIIDSIVETPPTIYGCLR